MRGNKRNKPDMAANNTKDEMKMGKGRWNC